MESARYLSLASLRSRIMAGLRTVRVVDTHENWSDMVYVPHFTVPALSMDGGTWPALDLHLGGFLVDKYQASHPAATHLERGCGLGFNPAPGGTAAVSRPGVVPWNSISWANALAACANRSLVNAGVCQLMGPFEWAAIAVMCRVLGLDVHGCHVGGRDRRDASAWENKGIAHPDSSNLALTGTGPETWSHCHNALGIYDLVGNLGEMLNSRVDANALRYQMLATLNESISDTDLDFSIRDVQTPARWPASGYFYLGTEWMRYSNMVNEAGGVYTLTGITRGVGGTVAGVHNEGNVGLSELWHYLIPGGCRSVLTDGGLNNTTDPTTVRIAYMPAEWALAGAIWGAGKSSWEVDDEILVGGEVVKVLTANGALLSVARGQRGTTPAAHASGATVIGLSPSAYKDAAYGDPAVREVANILTLRSGDGGLLDYLALPGTISELPNAGARAGLDALYVSAVCDETVLVRGGYGGILASAASYSPLHISVCSGDASVRSGFRAVCHIERTPLVPYGEV